jgi:hypothetical protein
MDLREIGWGGGCGFDWTGLAQGRDGWQAGVNSVMNFRLLVPQS